MNTKGSGMDDYWKVEQFKQDAELLYRVKSEDGFFLGYDMDGMEAVKSGEAPDVWQYPVQAAAFAHYANHLGIRPTAPVVELPSSFGCDFKLEGNTVSLCHDGTYTGMKCKASVIAWLRSMLAALEPEPEEVWTVSKSQVIDGNGSVIWCDGTGPWRYSHEERDQILHAIAREANRIEAERKGNTQ